MVGVVTFSEFLNAFVSWAYDEDEDDNEEELGGRPYTYTSPSLFDLSRTARGTDEDIIFVVRGGGG